MSDFNKSFLMGRLVRNAETKTTSGGLFIAKISIANNQSKKNQDGTWGETAHFFDITLFGKRAQALAPYLVKGQLVAVEGHLIQRRWEKDGKKCQRVEIATDDIKLVSRPRDKDEPQAGLDNPPPDADPYQDETPANEELSEPAFAEDIY